MVEFILFLFLSIAGLLYLLRLKVAHIRVLESLVEARAKEDEAHLQRLQHRAEVLHRLVDALDDSLLVTNQDLEVIFVNKSAVQLFPRVSTYHRSHITTLIHDHRMIEMIQEAVKNHERAQDNFLVTSAQRKGGAEDRFYSVEVVPIHREDPDNFDDVHLIVVQDQTGKYTLDKIRQDFVANASHELRTPLSIIIGYLENLMEGDFVEKEEQDRAFTIMKKHSDRLANIVEDLLVISRMESGNAQEVSLQDFDFHECAQDVLHRLSPVIGAKKAGVRITLETQADPIIRGDRYYWDQILFNLVSNALKENEGKNLIVEIALRQEESFSTVEVRDNGVGIPQMDLPFVFKRFYRVSRHRAAEVRGTGLGLSIVKRAVEAHKGKISVHSRPGIETVFTITIPRGNLALLPK